MASSRCRCTGCCSSRVLARLALSGCAHAARPGGDQRGSETVQKALCVAVGGGILSSPARRSRAGENLIAPSAQSPGGRPRALSDGAAVLWLPQWSSAHQESGASASSPLKSTPGSCQAEARRGRGGTRLRLRPSFLC